MLKPTHLYKYTLLLILLQNHTPKVFPNEVNVPPETQHVRHPHDSVERIEPIRCSPLQQQQQQQHSSNIPDSKVIIPKEWINDGYCDCPLDGGIDELHTEACSGSISGAWPGFRALTTSSTHLRIRNQNSQNQEKNVYFSCKQHPVMLIPPSRVNDGICDCCDGSDEDPTVTRTCPNECEKIQNEERKARQMLVEEFQVGYNRRHQEVSEFQTSITVYQKERDELERVTIPAVQEEIHQWETKFEEKKLRWMDDYFHAVQDLYQTVSNEILPGNEQNLKSFILAACHMQGEMMEHDQSIQEWSNQNTCVALRLAGLDLGIIWREDAFSNVTVRRSGLQDDEHISLDILVIFIHNQDSESDKRLNSDREDDTYEKWGVNHAYSDEKEDNEGDPAYQRHSKVESEDDDATPMGDFEEDYDYNNDHMNGEHSDSIPPSNANHDEWNTDGLDHENENHRYHDARENNDLYDTLQGDPPHRSKSEQDSPVHETNTHDHEYYIRRANIQDDIIDSKEYNSYLKVLRKPFYMQAQKVLRLIDQQLRTDVSDGDQGQSIDDISQVQNVRDEFSKKIRQIERGILFSKSAQKLVDALETAILSEEGHERFMQDLLSLAIGIIFHAKLRSADIVEIVSFYDISLNELENTCHFPSMFLCSMEPSNTLNVLGRNVVFPNQDLLIDVEQRCNSHEKNPHQKETCTTEQTDQSPTEIPIQVPDGYFNYYEHSPRDDKDYLSTIFDRSRLEPFNLTMARYYEDSLNDARKRLADAEDKVYELENKMGGTNISKYGLEGELFSIRNDCFQVQAGRYYYETCIFGKAYQRESEENAGSGTLLGSWEGMTINEDSGQRIMKWTRGMKCWQGTERSATVTVSCGPETVLLTAEEPETCVYILSMKSPIACDDKYKQKLCSPPSIC